MATVNTIVKHRITGQLKKIVLLFSSSSDTIAHTWVL